MKRLVGFVLMFVALGFSYVTSENGYVKIVFEDSYYDGDVDEVYLYGSLFDYVEMEREDGRWTALLELDDGVYDYVFLVNGEDQVLDPDSPATGVYDGEVRSVFAVLKMEGGVEILDPSDYRNKLYESLNYGVGIYRGRVYFKLADDGYDEVYLAGDFTEWEKNPIKLDRIDGFWIVLVDLEEGEHQYKYIVIKDGKKEWMVDPKAPAFVDDGFGGKNGYFVLTGKDGKLALGTERELEEKKSIMEFDESFLEKLPEGLSVENGYVFFKVKDIGAQKAYLSGTFNNWDPHGLEMTKVGNFWVTWLKLDPGRYQYKYVFVVSGQDVWKEDPKAPGYVPDGFGGKNGIFELKIEGDKLIIEGVESKEPIGGIHGELEFSYRIQLTEDGIALPSKASDFSLRLSYNPVDNLSFELSFDGAQIERASATFAWKDMTVSLVRGYPFILDFQNVGDYILAKYMGLVSAIGWGENLSYLVGFKTDKFEIFYSRDFLVNGGAVLVSFIGEILGSKFQIGSLLGDSEKTRFFGSVKNDSLSVKLTYSVIGDWILSAGWGDFNLELEMKETDKRIKAVIPSFVWSGINLVYEGEFHTLTSKNSFGVVVEGKNYNIELVYEFENAGFVTHYLVMRGHVGF